MAMVRSPRTNPSVPRGPCHGQTRWQTTRPRQGEVLAADDPGSAAQRALGPRLLPSTRAEGLDLPVVAAGVGPPRSGALDGCTAGEQAEAAPVFLPVRVVDLEAVSPRPAPPIEIVLPTGLIVRAPSGFDPRTLGRRPGRAGGPPMLSWPPTVKIFLGAEPTDMRKGFDSLAHLVESSMALDPLSGHLFVFRSRRGDRIKVLWWDRDGYCPLVQATRERQLPLPGRDDRRARRRASRSRRRT